MFNVEGGQSYHRIDRKRSGILRGGEPEPPELKTRMKTE